MQIYYACEERGRIAYKRSGGSRLITHNDHWKSQIRHALYTSSRFERCCDVLHSAGAASHFAAATWLQQSMPNTYVDHAAHSMSSAPHTPLQMIRMLLSMGSHCRAAVGDDHWAIADGFRDVLPSTCKVSDMPADQTESSM